MPSVEENLVKTLQTKDLKIKNQAKLSKQQEYYKRLTESGVAHKQSYSLKPVSSL
ncbi:MAG: hypothetical protein NPIRA05_22520 [Nitrospirales bacterium]|nr:MAG: hypothetical protein NPIRA05_22520 [Nitrospirales bacterium]